jgi:hypothetical protein
MCAIIPFLDRKAGLARLLRRVGGRHPRAAAL